MKNLISTLALATAIALPSAVAATPVTFTVDLKNYRGPGAYLALYVMNANENYVGSLWMAGGKSKYYRHMIGWTRATGGDVGEVAGSTGASIGSGRQLRVTLDLNDALFDAGYELHIDAAVENWRESPNDVVLPLTRGNLGVAVSGRRFIQSATFE